jgi:hypothetical protein
VLELSLLAQSGNLRGNVMNLQVNLPKALEIALKAQATAAGKDVESFVLETLELAVGQGTNGETTATLSHEQFRERLQQVIDLHPRGNASMDDSRESIYAGRGE